MSDTIAPAAPAATPAPAETPSDSSASANSTDTQDVDVVAEALGIDDDSSPEEIDAAQKAGEITKKEAQNLKKKLKIKVDGVEEDVELDFNDEEGLKRHIQKAKAFDKRAKDHATLQNQVDMFFQEFEKDPESVMRKLGKDPEKFAVEFLKKQVAEMEKSPEQSEREKMQKELEDLRQEKKRIEEEKQQAQMEKLRNQYATQIENEISEALESSKSVLPKGNPRIMKRIAQTMLQIMDLKDEKTGSPLYPDVKIADVLPVVEKEWREELGSYFDQSPEDKLEELVGKHNFERLRKKRLATRPKAPQANANSIKDTGTKEETPKPKQKIPMKKFFRDL